MIVKLHGNAVCSVFVDGAFGQGCNDLHCSVPGDGYKAIVFAEERIFQTAFGDAGWCIGGHGIGAAADGVVAFVDA